MTDPTTYRVSRTPGALHSPPRPAARRRLCDGHLASVRHWIEVGELIFWSALPPHSEIDNEHWWHFAFCWSCAPADLVDASADDHQTAAPPPSRPDCPPESRGGAAPSPSDSRSIS